MPDDPLYDFWERFEEQEGPASAGHVGDGYVVMAERLERRRDGSITGDVVLNNGRVVYQDLTAINVEKARQKWAEAAAKAAGDGGPTVAQLVNTILQDLLPDAMARLAESDSDRAEEEATQADQMVRLVTGDLATDAIEAGVELFHNAENEAFASVPVGQHREVWPLLSRGFRHWARRLYYKHFGRAPRAQAVSDAIDTLVGKALYDGTEEEVHVRLAEQNGVIFLDLGDPAWQAIMIDAAGWQVIRHAPVRFRRPGGLRALPIPVRGGSIDELRAFVHITDDDAWRLVVAWLVAALRPTGPYPTAVLSGPQGSAKSTLARMMRALVDPNKAPIRAMPRNDQDLVIAARNGWTVALDNVSQIPRWLSDGLCRLATGGGFSARQLYTDADEVLIDVQRPVILNGITEVATRPDLIDRSLLVTLSSFEKSGRPRRDEKELWAEFTRAQPRILGALLDAVSGALRRLPTTQVDGKPRMADLAVWLTAAEPSLGWDAGAFMAAYQKNRADANTLALESSPVAEVLRQIVNDECPAWSGTASELLADLNARASEKVQKQEGWPKAANSLSHTLKRLETNLRTDGIDVTFTKPGRGRHRMIELKWVRKTSSASSASSADPENPRNDGLSDDLDADDPAGDGSSAPSSASSADSDGDDADNPADDPAADGSSARSAEKSPRHQAFFDDADDADGADDLLHPFSSRDGGTCGVCGAMTDGAALCNGCQQRSAGAGAADDASPPSADDEWNGAPGSSPDFAPASGDDPAADESDEFSGIRSEVRSQNPQNRYEEGWV